LLRARRQTEKASFYQSTISEFESETRVDGRRGEHVREHAAVNTTSRGSGERAADKANKTLGTGKKRTSSLSD